MEIGHLGITPKTKITYSCFQHQMNSWWKVVIFQSNFCHFIHSNLSYRFSLESGTSCITRAIASLLNIDAGDLVNKSTNLPLKKTPESSTEKEVSMCTQCDKDFSISASIWSNFLQHYRELVEQFASFFLLHSPTSKLEFLPQGRGFLRIRMWAWFHSLLFTLPIVSQKSSEKNKWLGLNEFRKRALKSWQWV